MELAIGENSSEKCWEIGRTTYGVFRREIIGPKSSSGVGKEGREGKERKRKGKEENRQKEMPKKEPKKKNAPKMYLVRAAGRSLLVEPRYRGTL